MRNIKIERMGGTMAILVTNFKKKTMIRYYVQLSPKKPWLIPGVSRNFKKMGFDLYGWLFLYFGKEYIGLLYESDDKETILRDKKGRNYYLFSLDSYEEKMTIKKHLKLGTYFRVEKNDDKLCLLLEA